jgi:hypothetical protein
LSYIEENYPSFGHGYPEDLVRDFCARIEKLKEAGVFDRIRTYERDGVPEIVASTPQPHP